MTLNLSKMCIAGAKLGASGALICAIAWGFVAFDSPAGDVQEADATIFSLDLFAPPTKTQRFTQTLQSFDMEKPRVYQWNGNTMYFSMGSSKLPPKELLHQFQRAFVENGVNKQMHTELLPDLAEAAAANPQAEQRQILKQWSDTQTLRLDDFFSGGMVPIRIDPNYVAMAGAASPGKAADAMAFAREQIKNQRSLEDSVAEMRYVEARRAPGDKTTTISAIWSDDELDLLKFAPDSKRSDLGVLTDTPACLGCRRIMSLRGSGEEKKYSTNVFVGRQNVAETMAFYDRALSNRGWKLSGASQTMRLLSARGVIPAQNAQMSSFSKDGRFITVMAYPVGQNGRTQVHLFGSP